MEDERVVLCASSYYDKKYYLNPDFNGLPQSIKDELKIICVLFTEEIGGILSFVFDEDGTLLMETQADEGDLLYDEIGSALMIKEIQKSRQEFLESLETYYRVVMLGEPFEQESE